MKSRITIDVDYDNQPIIKIEYQESEDVRDKLVKKFMETFEGKSYFATFFYNNLGNVANSNATIRPIPPRELESHLGNLSSIIKQIPTDNIIKSE